MNGGNGRRVAYVNARLLDPASGLDEPGALLADGATIADLGPGLFAEGPPEDAVVIDCGGHCLAPGLVDTDLTRELDFPKISPENSVALLIELIGKFSPEQSGTLIQHTGETLPW